MIAKFFKEIGRVDELGSGVRNTFKYCDIYTPGTNPKFIEEDIFKTLTPLIVKERTTQITTQNISQKILQLLENDPTMSRKKIAETLGNITEDGVKYHLNRLKEKKLIERTGGARGKWKLL